MQVRGSPKVGSLTANEGMKGSRTSGTGALAVLAQALRSSGCDARSALRFGLTVAQARQAAMGVAGAGGGGGGTRDGGSVAAPSRRGGLSRAEVAVATDD